MIKNIDLKKKIYRTERTFVKSARLSFSNRV
jgi:hypothetical protein